MHQNHSNKFGSLCGSLERARMVDVKHRSRALVFWVIARVGLLVTPLRPGYRLYPLFSRFFDN
jgi:hypothetical protein